MSIFMAKVLGKPGRYLSQEATKRLHRMWAIAICSMTLLGVIAGFIFHASCSWFFVPPIWGMQATAALLVLFVGIGKLTFRRLDELEKERRTKLRGLSGEERVADVLGKLPDEFYVINDISTPTGNLDHVVVGPTGIFVIETKNWRGVVGADGKGELTHNDKNLANTYVKTFLMRMMTARDTVKALAPDVNRYFKALMVFTSAWLDVKFGSTGNVFCLREDQIFDHILENNRAGKLRPGEVDLIARAFASMAAMDPSFSQDAVGELEESSGDQPMQGAVSVGGTAG